MQEEISALTDLYPESTREEASENWLQLKKKIPKRTWIYLTKPQKKSSAILWNNRSKIRKIPTDKKLCRTKRLGEIISGVKLSSI